MYCRECGKEIDGGYGFCPYCGSKAGGIEIDSDVQETAAEPSRLTPLSYVLFAVCLAAGVAASYLIGGFFAFLLFPLLIVRGSFFRRLLSICVFGVVLGACIGFGLRLLLSLIGRT